MIKFAAAIFAFMTLGEAIAVLGKTIVPGAVWGLLLLLIVLIIRGKPAGEYGRNSERFLAYLSFFFVPAGAGIVTQLDVISRHWLALIVITIAGTFIAQLCICYLIKILFRRSCQA
ncbi:MAG: CidA/LrgA family protein [Bacillota bacterium]